MSQYAKFEISIWQARFCLTKVSEDRSQNNSTEWQH